MTPVVYTLMPLAAMVIGSAIAVIRPPGPAVSSGIQHFAAAASEILPDLKHEGSVLAIIIGGAAGVAAMLAIKWLSGRARGSWSLAAVTGADILIDGLVLGIGFAAGAKQGVLLTIALTIEILFLGMTVALGLQQTTASRLMDSRHHGCHRVAASSRGGDRHVGWRFAEIRLGFAVRVRPDCIALSRHGRAAGRGT